MKIVTAGRESGVKASMYEASGRVYAGVANDIGLGLEPQTVERWAVVMKRLAGVDTLVEADSSRAADIEQLLLLLTLDDTSTNREILKRLAEASVAADEAIAPHEHFDAREEEARACAAIFEQASGQHEGQNRDCWNELGNLAVAGIMLDSLCDSIEDANRLPQFTAPQLFTGALKRFGAMAIELDMRTWRSVLWQSRLYGLDAYIATKPYRVARMALKSL